MWIYCLIVVSTLTGSSRGYCSKSDCSSYRLTVRYRCNCCKSPSSIASLYYVQCSILYIWVDLISEYGLVIVLRPETSMTLDIIMKLYHQFHAFSWYILYHKWLIYIYYTRSSWWKKARHTWVKHERRHLFSSCRCKHGVSIPIFPVEHLWPGWFQVPDPCVFPARLGCLPPVNHLAV